MKLYIGGALDKEGYQVEALVFLHDGMEIFNPYESECTRFEVDPISYYGLSQCEVDRLVTANATLL